VDNDASVKPQAASVEITILRFIAKVTRRDRRKNVDIRKDLVINNDWFSKGS